MCLDADLYLVLANSQSSVKLLEQSTSQISNGPLLVAPLGFRPNSIFKGFEIPLEWMDRKLKNERKAQVGSCTILLWGPPGCGKSHLARQYVYLHRGENVAGTFWLDCKSGASMIRDWFEIGQRIGCLNESHGNQLVSDLSFVHTVREALEKLHGWLLVFDGVLFTSEVEIENFKNFLPDSQDNKIIYTSVNQTLARRQRLLVPSALRVPKLSKDAACELLFSSLNISVRKVTPAQQRKAVELVKHYSCLPLAIHAAAHTLIARGRALERFQIGPADNRLSQPILDLVDTLKEETTGGEALTLITLLSFVYHRVPVVLLQFGARFLADKGFEIESPDPDGRGKKHLDYTIAVLIQRGLVERQLQPLSASSSELDDQSPEASRKSTLITNPYTPGAAPSVPSQIPQDSSGLEVMLSDNNTEVESLESLPTGIDTLREHTVIQAVIRNEKQKSMSDYYEWLVLTCQFLHSSYRKAVQRTTAPGGQSSVTDFYEYRTHAQALYGHFPSSEKQVPESLFMARHRLRSLLREIDREVRSQSPSQASNGVMNGRRSVFEQSASSSDDSPDTPVQDLSRSTTWSLSRIGPNTDSPTDPHAQDATSDPYVTDDDGYTTDIDDLRDIRMLGQSSVKVSIAPSGEQPLANSSILEAVLRGRIPGKTKDLGEFKRVPIVAPAFEHVESPPRSSGEEVRKDSSSSSRAERALVALQVRTPPRTVSSGRSFDIPVQAQNVEYDSKPKVEKDLPKSQAKGSVKLPLGERSTNVPFHSTSPPLIPERNHARTLSSSPRLLNSVLASQAMAIRKIELPIEHNVTVGRRFSAVSMMPVKFVEGYVPAGVSIPEGYYSSTAMSRDQSRESHHSAKSLPTRPTSSAGSPPQDMFDAYIPTRLDLADHGSPAFTPVFEFEDGLEPTFGLPSSERLPKSPLQSQVLLTPPAGELQSLNALGLSCSDVRGRGDDTTV